MNSPKPSLTVLCNHALANGLTWLHTHQKFPTESLQYARAVLRIERASHYTVVGLARGNASARPGATTEQGPHEILFALAADVGMAVYSSAAIRRTDGNRVIGANLLGYADASHSGKLAGLLWPGTDDISNIKAITAHWQQHRATLPKAVPHEPH